MQERGKQKCFKEKSPKVMQKQGRCGKGSMTYMSKVDRKLMKVNGRKHIKRS